MIAILGYGCSSSAGPTTEYFWQGLQSGKDHSARLTPDARFKNLPSTFQTSAYLFPEHKACAQENLQTHLRYALNDLIYSLSTESKDKLRDSKNLGVILASTKGLIDDFIFEPDNEAKLRADPLSPVLEECLKINEIEPQEKICVSTACTSSVSALHMARTWIETRFVENVLVLACDQVGSFVLQGFQSLKVLTPDGTRPFSRDRSGFYLGEAAAAIFLSKNQDSHSNLSLTGIGIDSEGYALTRPSGSGESLIRAIDSLKLKRTPDLIIAHGTATQVNDLTEDRVFRTLFAEQSKPPLITGTKWSIGHTLAASGAMDLIAACEVLKNQKAFAIATTLSLDPSFGGSYLTASSKESNRAVDDVVITSLGFGGVHAAVRVERKLTR